MPPHKLNPEILDRLPPSDTEAEKHILGSILLKPSVLDDIGGKLAPDDFYSDQYRTLYGHLRTMHDEDRRIDVSLLRARLQQAGDLEAIGGVATIAEVAATVPVASNAAHYAALVVRASQHRRLIAAATETLRDAYAAQEDPAEILNRAEAALIGIETGDGSGEPVTAWDATSDAMSRIDLIHKRGESAGVMTGLFEYDRNMGGLFAGEFIVLAARPGIGKSALALQIAHHVASRGKLVYFVSLEMATVELLTRLLCSLGGVSGRRVRTANLTDQDMAAIAEVAGEVALKTLVFHDRSNLGVYDIRRASRRLKDVALIVVDYVQLIRPENPRDPRQEQVAKMSRTLKALARDLNVPVLCVAQLNREADKDGRPRMRHLKESGALEQDADVVLLLHRPDVPAGESDLDEKYRPMLIIDKNRNGQTAAIRLEWIPHLTRFKSGQAAYGEFSEFGN